MAKVMISLPDELLERIDAEARRRQTSRSALLRDAVQREIGDRDPEAMREAIARAREIFAKADLQGSSADVVRADRDERDRRDRVRGLG